MKLSRSLKHWFRKRDPRLLRRGIPALVACVAWLALGLCAILWSREPTEAHYAGIAEHALGRQDWETVRIASQRLLTLGREPRRKHLFDLA